MKNIIKYTLALLVVSSLFTSLFAQEVGVGTDIVSRYVWRGLDFGASPSIQPYLSFTAGGFEIGSWGAYQLGRDGDNAPGDELDLYANYGFDLSETASLGLLVTDYYFPSAKFGDYGDPGNHTIEAGVSLAISDLSISGYMNLYNDDDNTMYFEVA